MRTVTDKIDLTVVIPAYNEEERIGPSLQSIDRYLKARPKHWEVIVVDDGSGDKTQSVVESCQAAMENVRFIRLPKNCGKGRAVKEGVLAARGDRVLLSDADLAAPFEEIAKLEQAMDEGFETAVGSRALRDASSRVEQSFTRSLSGRVFNAIVRLLILRGFADTQCGFKMFKRDVIQAACRRQNLDGFSYDIELLFLIQKGGHRIKEVPISWSAQPGSKVRLWHDSIAMVRDIFKIRRIHCR